MAMQGTPVLVVGMHRSGTSAICHGLHALGLDLGAREALLPADDSNTDGYWEHRGLLQANETILARLGMMWQSCTLLPKDWLEYEHIEGDIERLHEILSFTFAHKSLWGWKDPRTTLILPIYRTLFQRHHIEPAIVICVRNPVDVASSIHKRDASPFRQAIGMWLQYTLEALKQSTGVRRAVVMYEDFLADPFSALKPVVDLIPEWSPSQDQWQEVRGLPHPQLNHGSKCKCDIDKVDPRIVSQTYDLCIRASKDPNGFANGDYDDEIWGLWTEFQAWWSIPPTGPNYASAVRLECAGVGDLTGQSFEAPYLPSPKRQTLRIPLDCVSAGALVTGSVMDRAGAMYLRRFEIQDANGICHAVPVEPEARVRITTENGKQKWTFVSGGPQFSFTMPSIPGPALFIIEFVSIVNPFETMRQVEQTGEECVALRRRVQELEGKLRQMAKQLAPQGRVAG